MSKNLSILKRTFASAVMLSLAVGTFGFLFSTSSIAQAAEGDTAQVTIMKYIDGAPATASSASSSDFTMNATYTIDSTPGSANYTLSSSGYNGDPTPYQAKTIPLPAGSNYGTSEVIDGTVVGASCVASTTPFSLAGYTYGESASEAAMQTPSPVSPNFTNLTSNKYVIVWNNKCLTDTATSTTATSTATTTPDSQIPVKVTIAKYVDGMPATASSSMSESFPMYAVYNAENIGAGAGNYTLSPSGYNGDPTPYQAKTSDMTKGASYSTNEVLDSGNTVGASCGTSTASSTQPFVFDGYTVGDTLAQAMIASRSSSTPSFTNMQNDKYVIVWNKTCTNSNGTIVGEVTGGATSSVGVLKVDSVTAVKTTATADGTYENGWRYVFNITTPTNEQDLSMKFADWMSNSGSTTLPVANNMRISSAQASSTSPVTITAANMYSSPALHITSDLNPSLAGNQVQVTVEVKIPSTTVNGTYSTNYGVRTQ